jgi:nitroreductase
MDAMQALTQRVSGKALIEPAPDDAAIEQLLSAAVRAPDHGRLKPWRFALVRGDDRRRFGELLATSYQNRNPQASSEQLDRERAKPTRAPLIIVVGASIRQEGPIPEIEQILAVGAATQNIMVAAYAMGFGCAWKTGEAAYAEDVKAAFGLGPTDAIIGFLYLGTERSAPMPPPTLQVKDFMREFVS